MQPAEFGPHRRFRDRPFGHPDLEDTGHFVPREKPQEGLHGLLFLPANADDAANPGMPLEQQARRFMAALGADARVTATSIQTVGVDEIRAAYEQIVATGQTGSSSFVNILSLSLGYFYSIRSKMPAI